MSRYMLLLYRGEQGPQSPAERAAEMPLWNELQESLRDAGLLIAGDPLHGVDTATTVRVRNDETEIVDGPFAVTKEFLAGYYLLECADLDEAVAVAAKIPAAWDGAVEVRPVITF